MGVVPLKNATYVFKNILLIKNKIFGLFFEISKNLN